MKAMEPALIHSINWTALPETIVHSTIHRREFHTDALSVVRYEFESGSVFPSHAHPESQLTMILSGTFTFQFENGREEYRAGDLVSIPGGVAHEGRAEHGTAVLLCLFAPPRKR
jgi:quercetin dioxygenase-like cupin family protein